MTAYFVAYALIFSISFVFYGTQMPKKEKNKKACILYFLILFLLFALRHPSMGIDLGYGGSYGYLGRYSVIAQFSWAQALTFFVQNYERGYILFNKLISLISDDQQMLLIGCAFASLAPILYTIYRESESPAVSVFIFMGIPAFMMLFSGMRQSIAIGLCFFALLYIKQKKLVKFIGVVFLASMFHYSASIFALAYPIYYFPMRKSWRPGTFAVILAVYILRYPIFSVLSKLLKENAVPDDNNAITLFLVFILVYAFCCLFSDEGEELRGLKNLFFVNCGIQAIGGVHSAAMRVGFYFMMSLILLLPSVINRVRKPKDRIIVRLLISVCFIVFGLHSLKNGTWAMSYPYYWFWEW